MTVAQPPRTVAQPTGWRRFLPGLDVLMHYQRSWLRGDVLAGVTVAAYLVPQVMAYAAIAGVPPVYGLLSCLAPFVVYAFVGGSRQLSVGPESTTALMTAAGAGLVVASTGPDRYLDAVAALALAVGIFCLVGWVARLGFLAEFLSRPVLVGYMAGVAGLMIVGQLGRLLHVTVTGSRTDQELLSAVRQLPNAHWPTVLLSALTVVALFAIRRIAPRWPGPLIVMIVATGAVTVLGASRLGVDVVGTVPVTLPVPRLPDLTGLPLGTLAYAAVGIALVGYSDNVLTGRAFAEKHGRHIYGTQEFLAIGLANLATGLTQGMPVSSSGSRTVLGDSLGSKTQLYSLVAGVFVVLTILFLGPALALFPTAALAAVIVYAALRLIEISDWRRLARFRTVEFGLAAVTALTVLFVGVLPGIGIAVVLSIVDLLRRLAAPHDGHPRVRARPRRHARRRRLPRRAAGRGHRRLPLRLAVVLRERRELPAPSTRRRRRGRPARSVVPAQRRGQRRGRPHRRRLPRLAASHLEPTRHRVRHGTRQAGPTRPARGRQASWSRWATTTSSRPCPRRWPRTSPGSTPRLAAR